MRESLSTAVSGDIPLRRTFLRALKATDPAAGARHSTPHDGASTDQSGHDHAVHIAPFSNDLAVAQDYASIALAWPGRPKDVKIRLAWGKVLINGAMLNTCMEHLTVRQSSEPRRELDHQTNLGGKGDR